MWPVKVIENQSAFYKDFLAGFSEKQFRSARFHTWFETPTSYYEQALKQLRLALPQINVPARHKTIQESNQPKETIKIGESELIKVFTDNQEAL